MGALALACAISAFCTFAAAATGTLNFTSDDPANWAGGIATDGQGGSTDLPGIAIQVYDLSSISGNLGTIEWRSAVDLANSVGFSGLTTFSAPTPDASWAGMAIRSADGSEFTLASFVWYDWNWSGRTVTARGYRDGVLVSSATFTANASDATVPVILGSGFTFVDEVRMTYDLGSGWPSINQIAIADAVVTLPGAPTSAAATAGNAQATVTFTAPSPGAAITSYTATSSPGGKTGSCAGPAACPITVTGLTNGTAYTFTVTATNSAGTGSASAASNSVTPRAPQTITFNSPGAQTFGTTPTLAATASSGLTVTFTSITTGVCTITSGGALTFVASGTCVINADQFGNAAFQPATTVQRSFPVAAVAPGAPTIGTATAGDAQATVSFTSPASSGGVPITGYTVTASPGGATGTGTSSPITVSGLTNGTAYTFTVTATSSAGTGAASAASNSVTPKAAQTITFANPGAQNFGTTPTLTATASSALTVTFTSSTSGVCTITSGGTLTFVTAGTCTINADQAGNGAWLAAATVSRSFTVNATAPGAPVIGTATSGDTQATVSFTAPASNGGAAITAYIVTASPGGAIASGAGAPIVVTGLTNGTAYTFTVAAKNSAGTGPASAASNSVTPRASQTINFANPGARSLGGFGSFTASASSGLAVTFTSSTTSVCTITSGGTYTLVSTGTCTINADQAGNAAFLPAATVTQSFAVNPTVPGAPTTVSAFAGDAQATVFFSAPSSNGGAAITSYTATSSPGGFTGSGTGTGIVVSGLTNGTAYTFRVTATNSAGTSAASAASNSVTPKAAQTITFNNPGAQNFATTPTLTATASSGLTVTFTSATAGVCTITSGGALTFLTTGTCTIDADQAGNGAWSAAPQAAQSFAVNAVVPGAPTIGTATAGDARATVTFTAPAFTGGASITTYTVTSSPGGIAASGASSPITVTGLTNGTAYTFTVTATNSAGAGAPSAASNSVTPKGAQTITFANPGVQAMGTSPTLPATATSGLAVAFTSSTTAVCTITTGGALTFATPGTCTINADQAGNGAWLAATTVTQSFAVNAGVPGAPAIGTAVAGDARATVSFIAPASNGGAAITSYTVTSSPGAVTASAGASPITVTGLTNGTAYTFTVAAANSAGTGAASAASNNVTPKGAQTITFANPGVQAMGTSPTLAASASSGLAVTFTSSTAAVCTITAGGTLTPVTTGTCTINADQAGNGTWLAAPTVTQSFAVNAGVPGAPAIGTAIAGDMRATVSFTPPAFNGGSAITSYTVTSSPGAITAAGSASPITVTGLANGTAYTFTATALNGAGAGAASAASNSVTPKGAQAITFANPGVRIVGVAATLTATASSGLAVAFTSSTPSICAIAGGGALTPLAPGTCTINADQAGNTAWLAASTVAQSFTINAAGSRTFTGPSATRSGTVSVALAGGGAGCGFSRAQLIRVTGDPASPAVAPPGGMTFPHGLFDFATSGCDAGSTITLTVSWPSPLPPGTRYLKFGPTPDDASPHWYELPATVNGNDTTFSITDGGLGDDDLAANGAIIDQGGPAAPAGVPAPVPVPALSEWALVLLALAMAGMGMRKARR